ncbi:c-type cytochrome [Pelagibius sp.]|uniref:c-type cytochrome n=1 Tax=Pelagibius sp. TaxID=1931238 RepID=UPI00261C0660|nr:cytochrome c [Pelagibius sp.]
MTAIRRRWVVPGFVAVIVAAAAVGTFALLSSQSGARIDPDNARLVALGGAVYAAECAVCHGANLEGQPNWRQRRADGRLPAPPHDPSGHTWHHPDEQLFALTKYGPAALAGGGYESDMPAYAGTLSDDEIWAVLSYIKSHWPAQIRERHDQINRAAQQ